MAVNACDICGCIPISMDDRFFYQAAINLLCDISSTSGTGATGLGKAESTAHVSGDVGVQSLGVRNDAKIALTSGDGQYSPIGLGPQGNVLTSMWYDVTIGGGSPHRLEDLAISSGQALMMVGSIRNDVPSSNVSDNGDATFFNQSSLGNLWVTPTPSVGGGAAMFLNAALTNTAVAVKASAGTLMSVEIYNPAAAVTYIQIFNVAAASVTLGTTVPNKSIGVPATNSVVIAFPMGIAFGTAISCAATTTATGSTAPATAAVVNIDYM